MSNQILNMSKFDYKLHTKVAGISDLIAADAHYHLNCLSDMDRKCGKIKQGKDSREDKPMAWLVSEWQMAGFQREPAVEPFRDTLEPSSESVLHVPDAMNTKHNPQQRSLGFLPIIQPPAHHV